VIIILRELRLLNAHCYIYHTANSKLHKSSAVYLEDSELAGALHWLQKTTVSENCPTIVY
jgi:hypothetical protein